MTNKSTHSRPQSFGPKLIGTDGNAMVEFAMVFPAMVAMLLGVMSGGLALDRYLTMVQLTRTGGSMYIRGVDWLQPNNVDVLLKTGPGLDITPDGGKGVVYFSKVTQGAVGSENEGYLVVTERFEIGDPAVAESTVASPDSAIWPDPANTNPNGDVGNFNEEISARATLSSAFEGLEAGEFLFVIEAHHVPDTVPFMNSYIPPPGKLSTRLTY